MKINTKLIKCFIFLFLFNNVFENLKADCSQSTLSASFKSNFQLMFDKKRAKGGGDCNKQTEAAGSGSNSASGSNSSSSSSSVVSSYSGTNSVSVSSSRAGSLIPDIPVLFQSWAKYFSYQSDGKNKPSNFFVNEDFDKQSVEQKESQEKDNVRK